MNQVWKIMRWEFINRVKTKLFLITTFALPFFMGALMYLPTLLMDLEPEDESTIGLVYEDKIKSLVGRFQERCNTALTTQDGGPQFFFIDLNSEKEALDSVLSKFIDGYVVIPSTCLLYTSPSPRDRQKSRMPSSA